MSSNDLLNTIRGIRKKIAESARKEMLLNGISIVTDQKLKLVHQFTNTLNEEPIGLLLEDGHQTTFDVLVGGAMSVSKETALSRNGKKLSPNFQINLHRFGELLGFKSEKRFLEIWVNDDDWGRGGRAFTRTVEISNKEMDSAVKLICDADGFDFKVGHAKLLSKTESQGSGPVFLTATMVGEGCLTESLMNLLGSYGIKFNGTIRICDEIDEETNGMADGLLLESATVGAPETDCCQKALDDSIKELVVWRPLVKLNGPNMDYNTGNVDQYSVFYKRDEDGMAIDFRAYYHRWHY